MNHHTTPLNAEIAATIAGVCLFSAGHWLGGAVCVALALHVGLKDRRAAARANLPSDEIDARAAALPAIAPPAIEPGEAKPDAWNSAGL